MGFASGTIGFRRYLIGGKVAKTVTSTVIESLVEHAFGSEKSVAGDGVEVGWLAPTHLFDTQIDLQKVSVGRFLHVWLRLDRTAAPAAVLRSYRQMEEHAARCATDNGKLSAEDRRQAKQAAEAKAQKEARQGRFRRISAYPVLVDLASGVVYLGAAGNAVHDKLRLLFAATFGATLDSLDAGELASQIMERAGRHRSLEDALPVHLIDPPDGAGGAGFEAKDQGFLGHEFLTWLWHRSETGDGTIPVIADGSAQLPDRVTVLMERLVQMDCDFNLSGRDVIYTSDPGSAPEARAALRIGKQPQRAGLTLAGDGEHYELTLDGPKWQVSGLKLADDEEIEASERLEDRCNRLVRCAGVLDGLFATFMTERFAPSFNRQLGHMRIWAANGHKESRQASAVRRDDVLKLVR